MSNYTHTWSVVVLGATGHVVRVEAKRARSLPGFTVIGLPDSALREASHRVGAAISSGALPFPSGHLTVNLAPASLKKAGTGFDLAIAVAAIATASAKCRNIARECVYLGECGLDGTIHPVTGVLPGVIAAVEQGKPRVVVPIQNLEEASLVPGARPLGVRNFGDLANHLGIEPAREVVYPDSEPLAMPAKTSLDAIDMAEVYGQFEGRLALEVAAAGGHNIFFLGTPGSGKTMLAKRLPTIMPPLSEKEAIETTAIHSVAGTLDPSEGLIYAPPFIAPHHNASMAAMIGGGSGLARPGAISLAHNGVLFLDEAPEFAPSVLDALRQPIESGSLTIHRSLGAVTLPAKFQLIMAANPCPCGYAGDTSGRCVCTPYQRRRYLTRLSGPLLDRMDIHVDMAPPKPGTLAGPAPESSASIRPRIEAARQVQRERSGCLNAFLKGPVLRKFVSAKQNLKLDELVEQSVITMRGKDRILRVARTLADLAGRDNLEADDIAKAFILRTRNGGQNG